MDVKNRYCFTVCTELTTVPGSVSNLSLFFSMNDPAVLFFIKTLHSYFDAKSKEKERKDYMKLYEELHEWCMDCLLYTSPSPRDS